MINKAKNIFVNLLVLGFIVAIAASCGSSNSVKGFWNGAEYEASVNNVEVVAGAYLLDPGMITSYATNSASMSISMSLNSGWGQFRDLILIWVSNVFSIETGVPYYLGSNGIGAKLTINGNILNPSGTITFTKLSNYSNRDVCADFEFYISNGSMLDLWGHFCGDVSVGY
jgi:hypothetical protein